VYKTLLKPLFFLLPPERAHYLTLFLLRLTLRTPLLGKLFRRLFHFEHPALQRELFGLRFDNPVGLAAGFDKDGKHIDEMASLGFGFIEVGTVTPKAQSGNPQPRLFRLPADEALINRLGFNNGGVEGLVARLRKRSKNRLIVGGNIGKNKNTPNAEAWSDYEACFRALHPLVDYFVVNVSSPNTPNLRDLQEKAPLLALLSRLQALNEQQDEQRPILLKIAPDLSQGQLDDIISITEELRLDGLIATNTTIGREGLQTPGGQLQEIGAGGLSGQPLKQRSTDVIRYLRANISIPCAIIGVGGIASPEDAREKLAAGADLVQLYTGMVYEGPMLIKRIKRHLVKGAEANDRAHRSEALSGK